MQSDQKANAVVPMWRKPDRYQRPAKSQHQRTPSAPLAKSIVPSYSTARPRIVTTECNEVATGCLYDAKLERRFTRQSIYRRCTNTRYTDEQLDAALRQTSRKVRPTLNFGKRHRGQGWNLWQRVVDPSAVVKKKVIRDPMGGTGVGTIRDVDNAGQPLKDICLVKSLRALGVQVECSVNGPIPCT